MNTILSIRISLLSLLLLSIFPTLVFANSLEQFNEKKYNSAFRSAYTDGSPEALYVLGKLYMLGLGDIKKNPSKAVKNLKLSIEKKYYRAAVFLAQEFEKGKNLKKNYAEARRLYLQVMSLNGPDFSKKIALLSQKMSDDDLTVNSCRDAKKAAQKNARVHYLYYTRCMLKEVGVKKDIPLIKKYIDKVTYKTQKEEILSLAKILSEGPDEIRKPANAYLLIEDYIKNKKPSENFTKELEKAKKDIKFKIEDCKSLVKDQNNETAIFICTKIEKSNNPSTLVSLNNIYQNNKNIFPMFDQNKKQILKKAINLGSLNAINLLSTVYKQREENLAFLSYLIAKQNDRSILSNIRNEMKNLIKEENINLINNFERDYSLKNTILNSITKNNCDLLIRVINKGDIKFLNEISSKVNFNDLSCKNNQSFEIITALSDLNNSKIKKAFFSFKELCAREVKNSCFFLAQMFINNNLPSSMDSFDKEDKDAFVTENLNKSYDLGNENAMVPLADILLANNKDIEKANLILDKAIANGQIDGLYIKAKYLLNKTFMAGKKTCKPLKQFLSNNVSNSKYYEKAIQLNNKRCK